MIRLHPAVVHFQLPGLWLHQVDKKKDSHFLLQNQRVQFCMDELSVENGMLLKGERIVIRRSLQQDILQQIHAGHQGAEKCQLRARSCVFWTSMNTDIDKEVHQCATCQEYQCAQPAETLRPQEIPTCPWQVVGYHLFYFDDHLIVANYYSKFPIVRKIPMGQCTSQTVVISQSKSSPSMAYHEL